ncbi:MAG: mfd [Haloplasmataceae bacterium]|jgi:transcription-repair coupling factor (superfamily II helicase)|nr:mfd [Haloplasmataceae bacterium]
MDTVISYVNDLFLTKDLHNKLKSKKKKMLLTNVNENLSSVLLADLYLNGKNNIMVVTPNLFQAQKAYDKLLQVLGEEHVHFFPMDEFISAEMLASSNEFRQERISSIVNLIENQKGIIVTHTIGAIRKLPPKDVMKNSIINLKNGDNINFDELIKKCIYMGYKRSNVVEGQGEIAIRGGIIDIFPFTEERPYRIEFFDDEIDSIRLFDEKTQRTINMTNEIKITPIFELIYSDEIKNRVIEKLHSEFTEKVKNKKSHTIDILKEYLTRDLNDIENYSDLTRIHKYISYFYNDCASIFDYFEDGLIVYLDYNSIINGFDNFNIEYNQFNTELLEDNKTVFIPNHYFNINDLLDYESNQLFIQEHTSFMKDIKLTDNLSFNSRIIENYYGNLNDLYDEIKRYIDIKTYCICFPTKTQISYFSENLEENNISYAVIGEKDQIIENKVNLIRSNIADGFELITENIKFITANELYKKVNKVVKYRSTIKDASKIKDLDELRVGDYVVHYDHGIGQYLGIQTLETNNIHKDFLQIAYKGEDKLYVPVENINLIQRYVGNEGTKPKINKIGGTEWAKTKHKVRTTIKDIADKLIKLYAEREKAQGFAYSPDTPEQSQFEENFIYVETQDQLQAVVEVKEDMESIKPMDRLLCGDVGYGKTEVAMRAAFKAVMDNKQVAYLAPTTILTQQHYNNFLERFSNFPINIALLNRFVSIKDQTEIIKKIKKGQIDIVIGTHRLLSKDIVFNDLGLLIVDEEQRFGVEHKERIKALKVNVDVLTLTATPIPRTLQMSLIGVRSLSLLETPPANRYPVQTYVLEENETVIKEAIERELARKGQIFYLYNHVEDIESKAVKIQELIPDAKITFAHGQMTKDKLEKTMFSFLKKEYDVLVCTTIIETGIDIANANTLIIADADKLGLSQLYQIRGRVGRSDKIAYAYMMYPKRKVLSEVANKRLQAIKEFTELGSGFKIAKQDLAIRGAGDLLGAQQYGFIDSVGFELYSKLLKEAIAENRNVVADFSEQFKNDKDIEIRILQDAYIPTNYISDESIKIEMYKKIKQLNSEDDLIEIQNELIDRFSEFPEPVENLLNFAFIKSCCQDLGVIKILETKTNVEFQFSEEASKNLNGEDLFMAANEISSNINFKYLHNQMFIYIDKPRLKENYLVLAKKLFVKIIHSRIM